MSLKYLKEFLVLSIKSKTEKVDWEALGTNASLLPIVYLIVMAPGLFAILGFVCFIIAGVASFFTELYLPVKFLLILGGSLIIPGVLLIIVYRVIIKYQFKLKKCHDLEKLKSQSPLDLALAPFLRQIMEEHRDFLDKK